MDKLQQQFQERPDLARGFIMTDLQTLCWTINETTEYCVFYHFSGHVNRLDVDVAISKNDFNNGMLRFSFYLSEDKFCSKTNKVMTPYESYQHIKKELTALLPKERFDEC